MTSVCILAAVLYRAMSMAPPVTPPSPPPSLPGAKQVLIELELITVTMLVDNKKKERKVWDLLRESLV